MTWTIVGNSSDLLVGVSAHGNPIIRGEGRHTPYIFEDWVSPEYPTMADALRRLMKVKADWRILSTDSVRDEIINSAPLLSALDSHSGRSTAGITCIENVGDSEPALSFTLALQPQSFQHVWELFSRLAFGSLENQYTISVGFMMFRHLGANVDLPTLDEFKSGHSYFSDEVSVSVQRSRRNGDA